jgi:predicted nucleic acid-binding protein
MKDRVFFDTNVLVYVIGQKDKRTPVSETLIAGRRPWLRRF